MSTVLQDTLTIFRMKTFSFILTCSTFSQFLPFFIGLYAFWKFEVEKSIQLFFAFIATGAICEIINFSILGNNCVDVNCCSNHFVLNFNWIVTTLILLLYLEKNKSIPTRFFWALLSLFSVFVVLRIFVFGSWWVWEIPVVLMSCFILLICSAMGLIKLVTNEVNNLFAQPVFWICSAILLYYTVNIVVFVLFKFLNVEQSSRFGDYIWSFHSLINIFTNLIYTYSFLCQIWVYKKNRL